MSVMQGVNEVVSGHERAPPLSAIRPRPRSGADVQLGLAPSPVKPQACRRCRVQLSRLPNEPARTHAERKAYNIHFNLNS